MSFWDNLEDMKSYYKFPKKGTQKFDHITPHVLEQLRRPQNVPTMAEARQQAKNFFETTASGANGLYMMTLLADDTLAMMFYGIRGAVREVWNFGKVR